MSLTSLHRVAFRAFFCVVTTTGIAVPASAHDLSVQECLEGGDFILHAAQARDAGYTRYRFLNQVVSDLISIQAYPPELRWFVQDQDDEALLVSAAEQVFDEPVEPDLHRDSFLQTCFTRTSSLSR